MLDYAEFVAGKCKSGEDILVGMSAWDAHILHMCLGVSGEVGELIDAFKKHIMYGKVLDKENVIEEIGDILFYMQGICNAMGYTFEQAMINNEAKLNKRYKKGYSNEAAIEREDKQWASTRKPKILVLGYKGHGKTTFADMLVKELAKLGLDLTYKDSSDFAFEKAVWPAISNRYPNQKEAIDDKDNARMYWYEAIKAYNNPDPGRLCRELLQESDIYVGMRSARELKYTKHLFDYIYVVDSSDRGKSKESTDSCTIDMDAVPGRIVVSNHWNTDYLGFLARDAAEVILRNLEYPPRP